MSDIKGMLVRPSAGPVLIESSEQNVSGVKDGIDLASAYQQSLVAIDDMAKTQGLIPNDPAKIGNSYQGVVVGVSKYHTLVKVSDGVGARHENDTLSRPMVVGECVKLDLENPRVIERGAKSIAGQDTGKPARISSEQTQDISSGLLKALNDSTRETRLLGTTPDPNAQAILGSRDVQELDKELATLGLKNLQAYSGGAFSVVLEAQGKVVRIGFGEGAPRPNVPEVLQAEHSGQVGFLRYEVLPKVDTHNISNAEVQVLHDQLNKRGYQWGDAGTDNVGRVDGRLVAIDPGGIEKVTSNHRDNTPKLDESGRDQVTEPASERVTTAMQIER